MLKRLLILAIIGGLLPLGASLWWVFELLSHFRLQYAVPATVLLGFALAHRQRMPAVVLAGVIALNLWPLLPYLPTRAAIASTPELSVLNINVNSDNTGFDEILNTIRRSDADIVTLIELSPELDQRLSVLSGYYPYRLTRPQADHFGLGILSRYPLLDTDALSLGPTTAAVAVVDAPAGPVGVLAVHLLPPVSALMAATRNEQLRQLAGFVRAVAEPLVVCGDFNLSPYSPYFRRFLQAADATDVRQGRGIGFSWPSSLPLLGIPIDHCFTRGGPASLDVERLARFGSDHYPVRVELSLQDSL